MPTWNAERLQASVQRGAPVSLRVDGESIAAFRGESLAAALLASGRRVLRRTARESAPRGLFCAMGICFDCVVTVNGRPGVRSCVTPVDEGLTVTTHRG